MVFNTKNELIGGRQRGGVVLQQFIKDFNCISSVCSFKGGDYGKPNEPNEYFKQEISEFKRLNVGEDDEFKIRNPWVIDPGDFYYERTMEYERISR